MSKFSIGDKVRYTSAGNRFGGTVGVVRNIIPAFFADLAVMRYAIEGVPFHVREDKLELVAKGPFMGNSHAATVTLEEARFEQAAVAVAQAGNAFWDKTVEAINARGALQAAQEVLEKAEADKAKADAEKARMAAVLERLEYEAGLASGTGYLLAEIKAMVAGTGKAAPRTILATYRHELTPLAETYGYTLVPVGDHSEAVLSAI